MSLVLRTIHSPEQKTKSAKKSLDSMSKLFFQSHRVQQVAPTVSPVGSVGASALCAEVSTGDPHPLQGRQKGLFNFDEARFSHFIDSLKSATRRRQIIRPFMSITPCLASFFYFFLFIKAFKENINIK